MSKKRRRQNLLVNKCQFYEYCEAVVDIQQVHTFSITIQPIFEGSHCINILSHYEIMDVKVNYVYIRYINTF